MTRLSRFLPKFLRGDKDKLNNNAKVGDKSHCKIMFLDDTEYFMPYKGGFKGQYILDKTYEQLNLFETDYFGLRYIDHTGQTHWLETNKTLSSQVKGCTIPYTFYFGVKFYPADPCKLKEEITRYQFFLQLKRDILHGRLPVTFDEAIELFAYAVQSELGDFESQELQLGYVSEFQFVPNQSEELEERIAAIHRRLGGTVPQTAELKFLDKVKWLDMYGVDLHPVLGEGNTEYFLGLTPTGIVVYKNKTKVGNYFWPRITKVTNKAKVFIIRVKDKINDEHTYAFELPTKAACKHLWKCCVEHHAFFRLNQVNSSTNTVSRAFRSTSKHRNSGRQERQSQASHGGREQPQVMRVQSRRQARRALSDSRLNQADRMQTGLQYSEGHVTMVVNPEPVKGSRHRSLPDLKGRESPTSTRSAPWETNMDTGLYTSGRESPVSVTQSENVNYLRRHRESDSESGHRRNRSRSRGYDSEGDRARQPHHYRSNHSFNNYPLSRRSDYDSDAHSSMYSSTHRRKYFPSSRKGSDNESDVSFTRRRRREHDSGSESDISPNKYKVRQRNAKSVGADAFEQDWQEAMQNVYIPGKENRPNGSLHSAPLGEAKQKKMRRRRSKSPGNNKRPPNEMKQHIEFDLVDPGEMTEEQMREIPYVNVETKAQPFKVKYSPKSSRHRYRSPKRKSASDVEPSGGRGGYVSEDSAPAAFSHTPPERTPEPTHRQPGGKPVGYYSDTGSRGDSLSRSRLGQPGPPPQYKNHQNNINPESKQHVVTDIRSIPQFHQNLLFYEPACIAPPSFIQTLPRYPPPTSIFKPIESQEDKHSVIDVGASGSKPQLHPPLSTDPPPGVVGAHELALDLQGHLNGGDEGQGHDPDEDRNRDSGLNSSQSSSSAAWNTTPRSTGNQQQGGTPRGAGSQNRMFGTQDAIARLYSSPHAGHRALSNDNPPVNQSTAGANRNAPYKVNMSTNQNMSYNPHQPPSSQSVHNQQTPSSVPNNYQTGSGGQHQQSRDSGVPYGHMNGGYNRSQQQSYNQSNRTQRNYQPQHDSHEQEVMIDYRNQSNFDRNQSNFDTSSAYSQQNRTAQYGAVSRSGGNVTNSPGKSFSQQQSYQPHNSYPSSSIQSTFQSEPPKFNNNAMKSEQNRTEQNRTSSQYQSGSSSMSQYQPSAENRLGVQPSWQYVGNGDVRSSVTQSGYRPSPSVQRSPAKTGTASPYARSPASSPTKKPDTSRQIELTPAREPSMGGGGGTSFNQSVNSPVSASKYRSPDSAISSLTSLSLNNNNSSSNNNNNIYTSPAMMKPGQHRVHESVMSHGQTSQHEWNQNFSRTRAPAFGTSDIWTEL